MADDLASISDSIAFRLLIIQDSCSWSYDNIPIMHGSEWTLKYDEPEVKNVT